MFFFGMWFILLGLADTNMKINRQSSPAWASSLPPPVPAPWTAGAAPAASTWRWPRSAGRGRTPCWGGRPGARGCRTPPAWPRGPGRSSPGTRRQGSRRCTCGPDLDRFNHFNVIDAYVIHMENATKVFDTDQNCEIKTRTYRKYLVLYACILTCDRVLSGHHALISKSLRKTSRPDWYLR